MPNFYGTKKPSLLTHNWAMLPANRWSTAAETQPLSDRGRFGSDLDFSRTIHELTWHPQPHTNRSIVRILLSIALIHSLRNLVQCMEPTIPKAPCQPWLLGKTFLLIRRPPKTPRGQDLDAPVFHLPSTGHTHGAIRSGRQTCTRRDPLMTR